MFGETITIDRLLFDNRLLFDKASPKFNRYIYIYIYNIYIYIYIYTQTHKLKN